MSSSAHRTDRAAWMLTALAAAGLLGGCPTFSEGDYIYLDDFETAACAGAPCGWNRVAGPDEGARWAESLPGEHGLHLVGDAVVVRVEPNADAESIGDSELALDLIARCDAGSTLSIEIGASDDFGTTLAFTPSLNTLTDWTEPRPNAVTLGSSGASIRWINSITIAKSGSGRCEIDWLGIFDSRRSR